MPKGKMIVVGEKESFIARVLVNKVKETGIECEFVHWKISDINEKIEGASLITLYMDDGVRPHEDEPYRFNGRKGNTNDNRRRDSGQAVYM